MRRVGWAPALVWAAGIFLMSVRPRPPELGPFGDKWLHALAYAVLAWLLRPPLGRTRRAGLLALLLAVLYGAALELLQGFLPWRTAEWTDLVANTAGAGVATVVASPLSRTGRGEGGP